VAARSQDPLHLAQHSRHVRHRLKEPRAHYQIERLSAKGQLSGIGLHAAYGWWTAREHDGRSINGRYMDTRLEQQQPSEQVSCSGPNVQQ
jgi:hypothetical protein